MTEDNKQELTTPYLALINKLNIEHPVHKAIYSDRIIASFLQKQENRELLSAALSKPSNQSFRKLDNAFKEHYTEIRFIKYVSTILYYEAVHFNQRHCKRQERVILLDHTHDASEDAFMGRLNLTHFDHTESKGGLDEQISSKELYHAFLSLTSRQQKILQLAYGDQLSDKDIARHFKVTQQAISQSRLAALKKLRQAIKNEAKNKTEVDAED